MPMRDGSMFREINKRSLQQISILIPHPSDKVQKLKNDRIEFEIET